MPAQLSGSRGFFTRCGQRSHAGRLSSPMVRSERVSSARDANTNAVSRIR